MNFLGEACGHMDEICVLPGTGCRRPLRASHSKVIPYYENWVVVTPFGVILPAFVTVCAPFVTVLIVHYSTRVHSGDRPSGEITAS